MDKKMKTKKLKAMNGDLIQSYCYHLSIFEKNCHSFSDGEAFTCNALYSLKQNNFFQYSGGGVHIKVKRLDYLNL